MQTTETRHSNQRPLAGLERWTPGQGRKWTREDETTGSGTKTGRSRSDKSGMVEDEGGVGLDVKRFTGTCLYGKHKTTTKVREKGTERPSVKVVGVRTGKIA